MKKNNSNTVSNLIGTALVLGVGGFLAYKNKDKINNLALNGTKKVLETVKKTSQFALDMLNKKETIDVEYKVIEK